MITTNTNKPIDRRKQNFGMNWISQHKRLAIYLRDGLACCYCGASVTDEVKLTLDHIIPHSHGGSNNETNLVTCCHTCNSIRGNRSVEAFAQATAEYRNNELKASDIVKHIAKTSSRPLDIPYAKELISRQGSCFKALKTL
jgi:5-methylcytosine-specific restriction endonuclease McrA